MNVKNEINKAIGVLEARREYLITNEGFAGEFSEDEFNALCLAMHSLEKWRDEDCTHLLPDVARQKIWFKQYALCEAQV